MNNNTGFVDARNEAYYRSNDGWNECCYLVVSARGRGGQEKAINTASRGTNNNDINRSVHIDFIQWRLLHAIYADRRHMMMTVSKSWHIKIEEREMHYWMANEQSTMFEWHWVDRFVGRVTQWRRCNRERERETLAVNDAVDIDDEW